MGKPKFPVGDTECSSARRALNVIVSDGCSPISRNSVQKGICFNLCKSQSSVRFEAEASSSLNRCLLAEQHTTRDEEAMN